MPIPTLPLSALAVLVAALLVLPLPLASEEAEPPPDLGATVLTERERIDSGREIFQEQCSLCHGRSAYPGKAPRLRPARYTAEFVYDRLTNGFRDMPAWKDAFTQEERVAIVAYIMSDRFSN